MKPTYDFGLGGEINKLCKASNNTNNQVWNNKAEQEQVNYATEDALCEVDPTQKVEDLENATIELDERVLALEEMLTSLMAERNK